MARRTKKFNGLIYHADSSWRRKTDAVARQASLKADSRSGRRSVRITIEPRTGGGASHKVWVRG